MGRAALASFNNQFPFDQIKEVSVRSGVGHVECPATPTAGDPALRRIETTMQRMELSFLAALPSSQRKLIAEGQPVIVEIVVTETDSQPKRPENRQGALQ